MFEVTYCTNEYAERQSAGEFNTLEAAQAGAFCLRREGYCWPTVWYPNGRKSVLTADGFTEPELVK